MAFKGWYSKQDVIKDLSKASGTRVSDLNEEYVVIGDQPPPPYRTDDSEEELQLLRLNGGYQGSTNTDIVKPDLDGIVQLLRMVDEYNDSPVNNGAKETNTQDMNTVISISKLNPNVVEFVPRSNNDIINKDIANVANKDLEVSGLSEENHNLRTSEYYKSDSSSINTISNKSITDSAEIKEMREKLKTKISSTSNTSCVQAKKERNLAMAMLIKLHTQPNDELTNNVPKPKLMTPDYFKTSLKHDAKVSNLENRSLNTPMELDVNFNQAINTDTCEDAKDNIRTNNLTNISNSRDLLTNTAKSDDITERNSPVYDNLNNSNTSITKEIKESIQKVDDWLNPKTNVDHKTSATISNNIDHKTSATTRKSMYLGPITFKRKNTTTKPESPISVESEPKSQNSKHSTDVFVPSTFANELTKKYEERNKVKEIQDHSADIWSKLEYELKVRDEIIKKKLQGNAEQQ